jgi:hydrogenase-4 component B
LPFAPDQLASGTIIASLWAATVVAFGLAALAALAGRDGVARLSPVLSVTGGVAATAFGVALLVSPGTLSAGAGSVAGLVPLDVDYDGLSGAFLVALGLSATAASLSIVGARPRSRLEGAAYPAFLLSLVIVLGAANAFAFLLAWELMALLSAFLVVGLRPNREVLGAGILYLGMTHVATAALLVGFALLTAGSGGQLGFEAWRGAAPTMPAATRDLVFVLVVVGFATKAGAMPFHAWLPRAHPVAPSHVSAVMSGVMIKTGIYGLIRILVDVMGGGPDWWGLTIIGIGALSAVLGVLYALMQHDLKRLLAFHSVENIGIILLGLGVALLLGAHGAAELATLALAAAVFHSINHAVFKTLLFLGAGAVLHATGLRDLNRLGGLARLMPVTALAFGVGAAAISGLPPLNGFASEWLVFQGLFGAAGTEAIPALARFGVAAAIGALALTAALAVACFVKATGITFLGLPRSAAAGGAHEVARPARAAMILLAATCVALGFGAGPVVASLSDVARSTLGAGPGAPIASDAVGAVAAVTSLPRGGEAATFAAFAVGLVLLLVVGAVTLFARRSVAARREDTWTCGIAPRAAYQYTATSYSKPLRLFFHRILLPERDVQVEYHPGTAFPVSIRYRSEITLVLEERVFRPAHELSVRASNLARRLQGGAIQLYLAYTVIAVLVLLVVAR